MKRVIGLLWFGLSLESFALNADLQTDLGPAGNGRVAAIFQKYLRSPVHCRAQGKGRRILIAGFGRWNGSDFNISGEVARGLTDPSFWPETSELRKVTALKDSAPKLLDPVLGSITTNRQLKIDGEDFEVCSLYLTVTWDLAAAILVHEMSGFAPALVLMGGQGTEGVVLEGAAANLARGGGYDSDGKPLELKNTPYCQGKPCNHLQAPILSPEQKGVEATIRLSWDNANLAKRSLTYFDWASQGVDVSAPSEHRDYNDYLCNNVAYVVAHAAKGIPIELAGGAIQLQAKLPSPPRVGFIHYPRHIPESADSVFRWARAVSSLWFRLTPEE